MTAVVRRAYGGPEVLEQVEVERPTPPDDGVLVRVRAASLNRIDWYSLTGTPLVGRPSMGLRAPQSPLLGRDFAGTVEAVGGAVTGFRAGDEVFGMGSGSLAEFVCAGPAIARKPAGLSFEAAAAVPLAGLTALQALRDHGGLRRGQKVLVNGASGGVGTFAVQIARALGADVTAVCSTANVEAARSLGADRVVDYTREDFTRSGERYDLLFDNAGSRSWRHCRRVLAEDATVVLVGGPKRSRLLGPLGHMLGMKVGAWRGPRKAVFFVASPNAADMDVLRELLEAGEIAPVVDRRYELGESAAALRYLGEGHARGKIVVALRPPAESTR
jgi:NADPH:quinone reductase-like Zn-dependent oxidoreductase